MLEFWLAQSMQLHHIRQYSAQLILYHIGLHATHPDQSKKRSARTCVIDLFISQSIISPHPHQLSILHIVLLHQLSLVVTSITV